MRLNKYLFNRVNNKERERGQRSVVWLKRGQLLIAEIDKIDDHKNLADRFPSTFDINR